MDIEEMLKEQQNWIDKAMEAASRGGAAAGAAPRDLRRRLIDAARESIDRLTRAKNETALRYEALIADELAALQRLEQEAADDEPSPSQDDGASAQPRSKRKK